MWCHPVVAPTFPKTKKDARGKALRSEVVDQAADARYVLDQVLDRASEFGIDPDEVGAAGMSLGGMTVYGLISHTCCADGRIQAAEVMAGVHDAELKRPTPLQVLADTGPNRYRLYINRNYVIFSAAPGN